jgi:hypothetical protein
VNGEQFRVWLTNETTIQQLLGLQAGSSSASIPNGWVLAGPGQAVTISPGAGTWTRRISPWQS